MRCIKKAAAAALIIAVILCAAACHPEGVRVYCGEFSIVVAKGWIYRLDTEKIVIYKDSYIMKIAVMDESEYSYEYFASAGDEEGTRLEDLNLDGVLCAGMPVVDEGFFYDRYAGEYNGKTVVVSIGETEDHDMIGRMLNTLRWE